MAPYYGECICRLLDALKWRAQGGHIVVSGGAVLLGNAIVVMAELVCGNTEKMWLEVDGARKCCVLQ